MGLGAIKKSSLTSEDFFKDLFFNYRFDGG